MCSPIAFLFIFITYRKVELQVKTHQSKTTIANDNNGLVAFLGQVSNKRQSQHFWGNILWTFNTIINAKCVRWSVEIKRVAQKQSRSCDTIHKLSVTVSYPASSSGQVIWFDGNQWHSREQYRLAQSRYCRPNFAPTLANLHCCTASIPGILCEVHWHLGDWLYFISRAGSDRIRNRIQTLAPFVSTSAPQAYYGRKTPTSTSKPHLMYGDPAITRVLFVKKKKKKKRTTPWLAHEG